MVFTINANQSQQRRKQIEESGQFGDLCLSALRGENIMRFHYQSHNYQPLKREAIAGLFLLLSPVLLPCLFTPFTYASPSIFSVCSFSPLHFKLKMGSGFYFSLSNFHGNEKWELHGSFNKKVAVTKNGKQG